MDEFKSMQDAVQEMFKTNKPLSQNNQNFELKKIVEQILGTLLLKYIDEIKIHQKTIIIRSHTSELKHEIKLLEQTLIHRINEIAGNNIVEKITIL